MYVYKNNHSHSDAASAAAAASDAAAAAGAATAARSAARCCRQRLPRPLLSHRNTFQLNVIQFIVKYV